jgi:membrane protease YdiL (CAAX protease family)/membrane protein implicated in regulation of membrane protease activity
MPSHEVLFERMPARSRLLWECLLVITLFFLPATLLAMPGAGIWYALGAGFVGWGAWALALTYRRPLAALAAVAGVAAMLWSTTVRAPQTPPRLGIQPRDRDGCAEVTHTIAGTPADGRLQPGDCITAVAGAPLDRAAPSADLLSRLRDETKLPAGPTRLSVTRGGVSSSVELRLGRAPRGPRLTGSDLPWLVLRSLAALALVGALLIADGQSERNIGLDLRRFPREILWGAPALAGAFATHLAVTIPIGLAMQLLGGLSEQTSDRMGALQGLAEVRALHLLPALVVLATLEEIVFRGFLLPRARSLTGRWWLAVGLVQLLFGLGHIYEGPLAVVQTTMLGVYFSVVFLWRVHLGAVIAAHTAFNAIMFALVLFIQRSGLLEKLPALK